MALFKETLATQKAPLKSMGIGKFGAQMATFPNGVKAIVKAQVFDNSPFRGIPRDSMHEREVMAYRFDRDVLGFNIVPETYMTRVGVKKASTQEFVNGLAAAQIVPKVFNKSLDDWKERVAKLAALVPQDEVQKLVAMDLVIGSRDRHAKNAIFNLDIGKCWAIDNGASFGKNLALYRNVFHKYFYLKNFSLSDDIAKALANVTPQACDDVLIWLDKRERDAVYARAQLVLDKANKLDFYTLSKGHLNNNEFPSYGRWIRSFLHREEQPELVLTW